MSFTIRGLRTAYDNIAVGSATGREKTITGVSETSELYGGVENLRTVSGGATSWLTSHPQDNIQSEVEMTTSELL